MSDEQIRALQQALELSPDNHPLRLMLAELLRTNGQHQLAAEQYDMLLRVGQLPRDALLIATETALQAGNTDLAARCLAAARSAGIIEGISRLQSQLDERLASQGVVRLELRGPQHGHSAPANLHSGQPSILFEHVGGLEAVKKVIHRMVILPLARPDLYQKYKKQSGGGVLLYGPPGCGKTMLARATAGECHLPFLNIRIEDILDPYFGVSERNLHESFVSARHQAPCVLFLDEVDALAFARRKHQGSGGRALVDQMLQELDAIGADNAGLLVLAATNAPWDVDDALLRPGRFDRRIFVPPPDAEARAHILAKLLEDLPTSRLDLRQLAAKTPLFSGADLKALVNQATDLVVEEALEQGQELPLTMQHIEAARATLRPTTVEWLARAGNYVEFANHDDRYKDVAEFLRTREASDAVKAYRRSNKA